MDCSNGEKERKVKERIHGGLGKRNHQESKSKGKNNNTKTIKSQCLSNFVWVKAKTMITQF